MAMFVRGLIAMISESITITVCMVNIVMGFLLPFPVNSNVNLYKLNTVKVTPIKYAL